MLNKFITPRFVREQNGTIAILWAMSLVVFAGFAALVFDIGRVGATQSELQSFADNVALASAGELDGKDDAIIRATAAANNLISDHQTFATGNQVLSGGTDFALTFHSTLPPSDTTALGANITNDPTLAAFAQVAVNQRSIALSFATMADNLLGQGNTVTALAGAQAVAGFTQEACDITPLMFCLPPGPYKADDHIGDQIKLRSGGHGAGWGPGDFGFLDPTKADLGATCNGLNGSNLIGCLVGAELAVTQCFTQRGVDMEPGQKVGIEDAVFNVRFDIYKSIMNGEKNDPNYPPAPNVISGLVPSGGGSCIGQNEAISPDTVNLPQDTCFSSTCTRYGDGVWDYAGYLAANHGGVDSHLTSHPTDPKFAGTRYETYLREILFGQTNTYPNGEILDPLTHSETGLSQCSPYRSTRPERRVVIAAGIDCVANPINGAQTGVPVEEFFELFLTEPVGDDGMSPPTLDLWVEILGSAGGNGFGAAGAGGIFRDVVQLYR